MPVLQQKPHYLVADPKTGEIIDPYGDQDAVAKWNTPELKQARLTAAFKITHPSPVPAEELAIEMSRPISIFNPGPAPVPEPGSEEEIEAVTQIIQESQDQDSPLTGTDYVAPPNILWKNQVSRQIRSWQVSGASFIAETPLPY